MGEKFQFLSENPGHGPSTIAILHKVLSLASILAKEVQSLSKLQNVFELCYSMILSFLCHPAVVLCYHIDPRRLSAWRRLKRQTLKSLSTPWGEFNVIQYQNGCSSRSPHILWLMLALGMSCTSFGMTASTALSKGTDSGLKQILQHIYVPFNLPKS